MRLFVAVQLSEKMREALLDIQDAMYDRGVDGNYTRPENMHLTLAFIGEYPDPQPILDVLETMDFAPFTIRLDGVGAFGNLWWAGIEKNEQLAQLVKELRHKLAEAGIPFDRKRFSPHLTLIRRADAPGGRMPEGLWEEAFGVAMVVDRISLMRSDRGKRGMIYTEL